MLPFLPFSLPFSLFSLQLLPSCSQILTPVPPKSKPQPPTIEPYVHERLLRPWFGFWTVWSLSLSSSLPFPHSLPSYLSLSLNHLHYSPLLQLLPFAIHSTKKWEGFCRRLKKKYCKKTMLLMCTWVTGAHKISCCRNRGLHAMPQNKSLSTGVVM